VCAFCRRLENPRVFSCFDVLDFHAIHYYVESGHAVRTGVVGRTWHGGEIGQDSGLLELFAAAIIRAAKLVVKTSISSSKN